VAKPKKAVLLFHIVMSSILEGIQTQIPGCIFEPFFTTKEFGRNSGLGLCIVYGCVKQSGGVIHATSESGVGTEIEILIPDSKDAVAQKDETDELRQTGSVTIILVEDDPDVIELTNNVLESLGYNVFAAEDGPSLLLRIDELEKADLLLTDVILPKGMRGPVVAKEVEKRFPGIPVLFISGYAEQSLYDEGGDKFPDFLPKPFSARNWRKLLANF